MDGIVDQTVARNVSMSNASADSVRKNPISNFVCAFSAASAVGNSATEMKS